MYLSKKVPRGPAARKIYLHFNLFVEKANQNDPKLEEKRKTKGLFGTNEKTG